MQLKWVHYKIQCMTYHTWLCMKHWLEYKMCDIFCEQISNTQEHELQSSKYWKSQLYLLINPKYGIMHKAAFTVLHPMLPLIDSCLVYIRSNTRQLLQFCTHAYTITDSCLLFLSIFLAYQLVWPKSIRMQCIQ